MKKYEFEIRESLPRIIEVIANNEDDAYRKVKDMYRKEEIVLDSSDAIDFSIKKRLSIDDETEKDNLIAEIVDYLYQDEKKHFEEFDEQKPLDHIFLKLKKLKELI